MPTFRNVEPSPNGLRRASTMASPYALAIVLVFGAFLARYSLGARFGDRSALDLFLVPVAVSAWLGGIGPSILALGSSLLLALWYFIPPEGSLWLTELVDAVETASFVFAGTTISVIIHFMKRATRRVRKSAGEAIQKQCELELEVELRRRAEKDLQTLNGKLETRVSERTVELAAATQAARRSAEETLEQHSELLKEVEVRRQVEHELQVLNARLEDRVNDRTVELRGALKELEGIVSRLEQGEVDLEDSIALYERGQALKNHCESKLKSAESRLEKIIQGVAGPAIGERLDVA